MIGVIYKWVNVINSKAYIGQTLNQKRRYKEFLNSGYSYTSKDSKIDRARVKYGVSAFRYEILEKVESEDKDYVINKLNELEVHYIQRYDSILHGYNSMEGGRSYKHREGYTITRVHPIKQCIPCNNDVYVPSKMILQGKLIPRDVLIYSYLKCYDNAEHECFPSITMLSERSGISRDTVIASINSLVHSKHISVETHKFNYYEFASAAQYDKFNLKFIDNSYLTFNERAYLMSLYPFMTKDAKLGGILSTKREYVSKVLNISESTVYRLNKSLSRKEVLQIFKEAKRDLETGCAEEVWIFNLQKIGQAALWLIEKNSEDVEDLKKENAELRKTMKIILDEVAELKRNQHTYIMQ